MPAFLLLFWTCLSALVALTGGLAVVTSKDAGDTDARWFIPAVLLWVASAAGVVFCARRLHRTLGRNLALATTMAALVALVTLVFANVAASLVIPPWPARALHGVDPKAWAQAFSTAEGDANAVGWNSWGQRDRPREATPAPGSRRVALVGDSLLEEGSTVPLNVRMEQVLHTPDLEVINLGVSASAPDEYFYRVRNVALPLGATDVMMFIYAGNDLINKRTLRSLMGISATSPRDSLLSVVGLNALTHVTMNWRRPVLRAWGQGGEELQAEMRMHKELIAATDEQLVTRFARHVEDKKDVLTAWLSRAEVGSFWAMIRAPDQNRFRSYFLWPALEHAAGRPTMTVNGVDFTAGWPTLAAQECARHGVKFTVVLIPEAFAVDDRMVEQWGPVAPMRTVMAPKAEALDQVGKLLRTRGIEVVDLNEVLLHSRGTYLNMDGHWSQAGVDMVAHALAQRFQDATP